jgi:hypothetical protein
MLSMAMQAHLLPDLAETPVSSPPTAVPAGQAHSVAFCFRRSTPSVAAGVDSLYWLMCLVAPCHCAGSELSATTSSIQEPDGFQVRLLAARVHEASDATQQPLRSRCSADWRPTDLVT